MYILFIKNVAATLRRGVLTQHRTTGYYTRSTRQFHLYRKFLYVIILIISSFSWYCAPSNGILAWFLINSEVRSFVS